MIHVSRRLVAAAQAIATAALEIAAGYAAAAVAGGMENMDQAPYLVPGARWGHRMGDAQMLDSMLRDGLHDAFSGQHSGWHTEDADDAPAAFDAARRLEAGHRDLVHLRRSGHCAGARNALMERRSADR